MTDGERVPMPYYGRNPDRPMPNVQELLAWQHQVIMDAVGDKLPGEPRVAQELVQAPRRRRTKRLARRSIHIPYPD